MNNVPPYVVEKHDIDAARPYAVVATYRNFNRVISKYADKSKAVRRAHDMNKTNSNRSRVSHETNAR